MAKEKNEKSLIKVDTKKLSIIRFYLMEKGLDINIEERMTAAANAELDKLYTRHVPKDVRYMLENESRIYGTDTTAEKKEDNSNG